MVLSSFNESNIVSHQKSKKSHTQGRFGDTERKIRQTHIKAVSN